MIQGNVTKGCSRDAVSYKKHRHPIKATKVMIRMIYYKVLCSSAYILVYTATSSVFTSQGALVHPH